MPPLKSIRVFDAVARHLNFTRAGEELGMTQSAVSYQIRILEDRFGEALFVRSPLEVRLTEAGRRLAGPTRDALEILQEAWAPRPTSTTTLFVSAPPTMAIRWLAPRLPRFRALHPDLSIRIGIDSTFADPTEGRTDIAIRFGDGGWPGMEQTPLLKFDFAPMWSPTFETRFGAVADPADLLDKPRLAGSDPAWARWFRSVGVTTPLPKSTSDLSFHDQTYEVGPALAGEMAALLTPRFFRDDIEAGRLRYPFPATPLFDGQLWLVHPHRRRDNRRVSAFKDWILSEISDDDAN